MTIINIPLHNINFNPRTTKFKLYTIIIHESRNEYPNLKFPNFNPTQILALLEWIFSDACTSEWIKFKFTFNYQNPALELLIHRYQQVQPLDSNLLHSQGLLLVDLGLLLLVPAPVANGDCPD